MYVLFSSVPLVGHANPLLRQAEELQRRGHRVADAGARELRHHVAAEAPGIPFLDLGPIGPIADRIDHARRQATRDPVFWRNTLRILEPLWATWPLLHDGMRDAIAADRPDVAVVDSFTTGAITAADAAGVPCVVNASLLGVLSTRLLPPADHLPLTLSGRSRHDWRALDRITAPLRRELVALGISAVAGRRLNRLRASRGLPPIDIHALHRHRQVLVNGAFGLEYECSAISWIWPCASPTPASASGSTRPTSAPCSCAGRSCGSSRTRPSSSRWRRCSGTWWRQAAWRGRPI